MSHSERTGERPGLRSSLERSAEEKRTVLVPEPALDAEDAPIAEGEAVALPLPTGIDVTLRFPSAFEPFLTLAGRRVVDDASFEARELLLWSSRRLPALWRALEDSMGLRALFCPPPVASSGFSGVVSSGGAHIVVTDLVRLEDEVFLDHGTMREKLEAASLELARFSLLGSIGTRAELEKRVRATWAPGTLVEVRMEDGRRVASRRRVRVGR